MITLTEGCVNSDACLSYSLVFQTDSLHADAKIAVFLLLPSDHHTFFSLAEGHWGVECCPLGHGADLAFDPPPCGISLLTTKTVVSSFRCQITILSSQIMWFTLKSSLSFRLQLI